MKNGAVISQDDAGHRPATIAKDDAARRFEDALRLRVGRGKRYSFDALSDATRIPTRTLESYVQGVTPPLHAFLSICSVLGPSFTSDILAACNQAAHEVNPGDPEHLRVVASLGELVTQISMAVADGYVDHREAAQMRPIAARLIELLEPLALDRGAR
ncbi:hypothetical protein SAMN05877809_10725 [Rhodobacter sp. JA431]|uniref:hypothetical protein n=1 Tax=Rhodobacter sp. JA431 TaxID=570013 RepID=UPI000BD508C2|nr:hypothetical protein [Rhodobacter sp. JA431]SOC13848.1 hypothetical protein SAMN05877809_10725 [Rhodobacter sp. JA431]